MRLVFLGPPGAGKGTVAGLLSARQGVIHVGSGDLLREAVAKGKPLGRKARGYMEKGALVPDELVTGMVLGFLERLEGSQGFVLDGFPRTAHQAAALDEALARWGHRPIHLAVNFTVSREKIVERLSGRRVCSRCGTPFHVATLRPKQEGVCDRCGGALKVRPDDESQTILKRLDVYEETARPLLDFYERQGKLRSFPVGRAVEEEYVSLVELLTAERLLN
jgi:adenylate kinase